MGKYVTVSVKVPLEVKRRLEELGIKPSDLLRKAIEEELRRRELEEIESELDELGTVLEKFSDDFVVKSVREDRGFR
ncbi:MAG: hypothetical protein QXX87_01715 [Candidatus Jordarchaeales archaeon]